MRVGRLARVVLDALVRVLCPVSQCLEFNRRGAAPGRIESDLPRALNHFDGIQHRRVGSCPTLLGGMNGVAENDQAHTQARLAQTQYQMSVAMLLNVMGKTETRFEESSDDTTQL